MLTERETISHLHKALEAITKSIDAISRGNALLGKNGKSCHRLLYDSLTSFQIAPITMWQTRIIALRTLHTSSARRCVRRGRSMVRLRSRRRL